MKSWPAAVTHTHTHTTEDAPMSHCDTNPAVTQQQICRHARIQRGCSESRAAPTGKETFGLHEKRVRGGTRKALIAGKTRWAYPVSLLVEHYLLHVAEAEISTYLGFKILGSEAQNLTWDFLLPCS